MHTKTKNLTITAIFMAIILLQNFVPFLGSIRILPALPAITTIPATIAIYSLLMGSKFGSLLGLFWGLISLYRAYTQPGDLVSLMLFQNPIIAIVPRVLAGFFPGLIGKYLPKINFKKTILGYTLGGLSASVVNTVFVVLLTSLIFGNSKTLMHNLGDVQNTPIITVLSVALAANGISEAIFTAIVTPIVVKPLKQVLNRH